MSMDRNKNWHTQFNWALTYGITSSVLKQNLYQFICLCTQTKKVYAATKSTSVTSVLNSILLEVYTVKFVFLCLLVYMSNFTLKICDIIHIRCMNVITIFFVKTARLFQEFHNIVCTCCMHVVNVRQWSHCASTYLELIAHRICTNIWQAIHQIANSNSAHAHIGS
jgi:hypothetical protein